MFGWVFFCYFFFKVRNKAHGSFTYQEKKLGPYKFLSAQPKFLGEQDKTIYKNDPDSEIPSSTNLTVNTSIYLVIFRE